MTKDSIEKFLLIESPKFRFLESLAINRYLDEGSASAYQLQLVLACSPTANAPRLSIQFEGVCNLRLGDLEGLMGLLVEIHDIADRGMDALRYRVVESEEDAFSFDCNSFAFEVMK